MKTRRQFLASSATGLVAAPTLAAEKEERPLFSFGLMADCQYADSDTRGSRFYRESPRKLAAAVEELNQHDLAFTFHLGDFIDRDFVSFDVLEPIAGKLNSKLYHALGNHDFDVEDGKKTNVPPKLGLENGYYSFQKDGFRFVVIDTTDVSTYRHPKGSEAQKAAAEELKKLQKAGVSGSKPWNGRPGEKQLEWLESKLKEATKLKEKVLVFGHHPILPEEGHVIWNADVVSKILQKNACAKLYMNGHNHAGHYLDSGGFHYLTLDGMLETKDQNAFAYANLFADRLELTGFGRQESHVLKFR
ncbi:MAG: hypothetical protein HKN23_21385 [Verrucomicrobiales bacterium]|nr:hypothetical protein [Verrucomicrobiales bacterium]